MLNHNSMGSCFHVREIKRLISTGLSLTTMPCTNAPKGLGAGALIHIMLTEPPSGMGYIFLEEGEPTNSHKRQYMG